MEFQYIIAVDHRISGSDVYKGVVVIDITGVSEVIGLKSRRHWNKHIKQEGYPVHIARSTYFWCAGDDCRSRGRKCC